MKLKNNPKFQRHIQCLQFLILFSSRMVKPLIHWKVLIHLLWPTRSPKFLGK
nr:hypothetical protein Iba_scaffold15413CG0020 [Ipomoea batatas]